MSDEHVFVQVYLYKFVFCTSFLSVNKFIKNILLVLKVMCTLYCDADVWYLRLYLN